MLEEQTDIVYTRWRDSIAEEFVCCAVEALAANGIGTYIFDRVRLTSLLSFIIREFDYFIGVLADQVYLRASADLDVKIAACEL